MKKSAQHAGFTAESARGWNAALSNCRILTKQLVPAAENAA
jgi:hypothetical protein